MRLKLIIFLYCTISLCLFIVDNIIHTGIMAIIKISLCLLMRHTQYYIYVPVYWYIQYFTEKLILINKTIFRANLHVSFFLLLFS